MKSFVAMAILTSALLLQVPSAYAETRTAILSVSNMTCAACPITVKKALSRVEGVSTVKVDFDKKQAIVTFDDAKAGVAALTKATTDAGYPSALVEGGAK